MTDLIKVNYNNENPTVSGRDLHRSLQVKTAYKDWFPRMVEYGFLEGTDFCSFLSESSGGRPALNHQLSISMAKEICMLQRTEVGKAIRRYFIELEEKWNSPESVMARALELANKKLCFIQNINEELSKNIAIKEQQLLEMKPKASYYDIVLNCRDLIPITTIAKDYGKSAYWLNKFLEKQGIQYKKSGTWLLYQKYASLGYTSTRTATYTDSKGEVHFKIHTYWTQKGRLFIYELMKDHGHYPLVEEEVAS